MDMTSGVGPQMAFKVLSAFGSFYQVFQQSLLQLSHVAGPQVAKALSEPHALCDCQVNITKQMDIKGRTRNCPRGLDMVGRCLLRLMVTNT
ncbi:MAG: hypothetical protein WCO80_10355 [Betaproteobacteria bacterium]